MGRVKDKWLEQHENMYLEQLIQESNQQYANRINNTPPIRSTRTINTGEEILTIDTETGEIIVTGDPLDTNRLRTSKIKVLQLLKPQDFYSINGVWEVKRDGLIKILSSLPISYQWEIKSLELKSTYAQTHGILTIKVGSVTRQSDSIGICELDELQENKTKHIMSATSETRALKRAIETLFGGVINYYVIHHLEAA